MSRHPYFNTHQPTVNYKEYPDKLHVVVVLSNPRRYESRYRLFKEFMRRLRKETNINVIVVEVAYGNRPHYGVDDRVLVENDSTILENAFSANHLCLRTQYELWHKENMMNIGFQMLPQNWKYAAWIDADVKFEREDWVNETIEQLQHYAVVQMFQTGVDLGPDGQVLQVRPSFGWKFNQGLLNIENNYPVRDHSTGYAWAIRRDAFDALGGFIDYDILGAGDWHMAYGLAGLMRSSFGPLNPEFNPNLQNEYKNRLMTWEERANRYIKQNVGFVPGTVIHYWHGRKANRRYHDRWKILVENKFDPRTDLKRDWQGLYQLEVYEPRQVKLRDDIKNYFACREEDSIDI